MTEHDKKNNNKTTYTGQTTIADGWFICKTFFAHPLKNAKLPARIRRLVSWEDVARLNCGVYSIDPLPGKYY